MFTMLLLLGAALAISSYAVQVGGAKKADLALGAASQNGPTCGQIGAAYADIKKAILATTGPDEDGKPHLSLIPGIVRLTFHMCAGGKCKGCLNVNDDHNAHLDKIIDVLEPLYKRHSSNFRRGDFWALAGIVALQTSEEITNVRLKRDNVFMKKRLPFRYGREDCSPSSPFTNALNDFPDASKGIDHVLKFFADNFNFNAEDTVVLLGVHNLGGLRDRARHNIVHQWTTPADSLTNAYYVSLRSPASRWTQRVFNPCPTCDPVWHFVQGSTGKRLMLNADMSLLKNLTFANGVSGSATCTFQTCPFSNTRKFVDKNADSDDDWQSNFAKVYTRMIETGYKKGVLKTPARCPAFAGSGN